MPYIGMRLHLYGLSVNMKMIYVYHYVVWCLLCYIEV